MTATPIRAALVVTSTLRARVKDGLGAVARSHKGYVDAGLRSAFTDSVDIDEAFAAGHEQENRWDYLLGHEASRRILGLEPHSASNKEISVVIRKRARSLEHLREHLKPGLYVAEWFWVASGKVDFTPMDKAVRRLDDNGIKFVGKQLLAKALGPATPAEAASDAPQGRKTPRRRRAKR